MNNWFAAAAAGVLAIFGASSTGDHKPPRDFNQGSTTHKEERMGISTKNTFDISCVKSAIAAREASLGTALTTYSSGITGAYSKRASDLSAAYALTGNDQIKAAVKVAWKTFSTTVQASKKAWQKSKESSWQSFKTAIKSCGKGAESVADISGAGQELNGQ